MPAHTFHPPVSIGQLLRYECLDSHQANAPKMPKRRSASLPNIYIFLSTITHFIHRSVISEDRNHSLRIPPQFADISFSLNDNRPVRTILFFTHARTFSYVHIDNITPARKTAVLRLYNEFEIPLLISAVRHYISVSVYVISQHFVAPGALKIEPIAAQFYLCCISFSMDRCLISDAYLRCTRKIRRIAEPWGQLTYKWSSSTELPLLHFSYVVLGWARRRGPYTRYFF